MSTLAALARRWSPALGGEGRRAAAHPVGSVRAALAQAVTWLVPLLLVLQISCSVHGEPLLTSVLFVGVSLAALWLADPTAPACGVGWAARALGLASLALGVVWLAEPAQVAVAVGLGQRRALPDIATPPGIDRLGAGALLAAAGFGLLRGRRPGPLDYQRYGALIALGSVTLLASGFRYEHLPVFLLDPAGKSALAGAAVLLGLLLLPFALAWRGRIVAVGGLSVALKLLALRTWQIHPATRDMLALVSSAHDAFARGEPPYALHQMQLGSQVPLTYLPGLWLGYGLPRLVGADLRVMAAVSDALLFGGLWLLAGRARAERRPWACSLAVAFGAVWAVHPGALWNAVYAEPPLWWGVLAALVTALWLGRWWWTAVLLGVALATRHFALVLLPFVVLLAQRELGTRAALRRLAVIGVVTTALLLPFVAKNPEVFWFGTLRWLREYGPAHRTWFYDKLGFSGTLYRAQLEAWLPWLQLSVVSALLALAGFARRRRTLLAAAATAYLLFITLNGIVWYSFYLGASIFLMLCLVGAQGLRGPVGAPTTALRPAHPHIPTDTSAHTPMDAPRDAPARPPTDTPTDTPSDTAEGTYTATPSATPAEASAGTRTVTPTAHAALASEQTFREARLALARHATPCPPALDTLCLGALALSLGAGGWLLWTLARSLSAPGAAAMQARVRASVQPGDAIVDNSDWQLAFVRGTPLVAGAHPPGSTAPRPWRDLSEWLTGGVPSHPARLHWLRRDGLPLPSREHFGALGTGIESWHAGVFELLSLTPYRRGPQLANLLERLDVALADAQGRLAQPATRSAAGWSFPGASTWARVARQRCRIGGQQPWMLFAQPIDAGRLTLRFRDLDLRRALVVYAGLEDTAVEWGRAPVDLTLRVGGQPPVALQVPNAPGLVWLPIETRAVRSPATLELGISTRDATRRWLCVNGVVLD